MRAGSRQRSILRTRKQVMRVRVLQGVNIRVMTICTFVLSFEVLKYANELLYYIHHCHSWREWESRSSYFACSVGPRFYLGTKCLRLFRMRTKLIWLFFQLQLNTGSCLRAATTPRRHVSSLRTVRPRARAVRVVRARRARQARPAGRTPHISHDACCCKLC